MAVTAIRRRAVFVGFGIRLATASLG